MEQEQGKAALIATIESDARAEQEKIISEAQIQAQEKQLYAEKKVESILNEARQKAQEQAGTVKNKILADVDSEIKRLFLQEQNSVISQVLDSVVREMYSKIDEQGYREILIDWIVEAAVGLGAESALINASEKERDLIDDKLIKEVEGKVEKVGGKKVSLSLSKDSPLKDQGVVLTAGNGRIAFNNQLKTRVSRNQRKIRTMIYDVLFSDTKEV